MGIGGGGLDGLSRNDHRNRGDRICAPVVVFPHEGDGMSMIHLTRKPNVKAKINRNWDNGYTINPRTHVILSTTGDIGSRWGDSECESCGQNGSACSGCPEMEDE